MTNLLFLFIEFLDELVFGVTDAAWPLIRTDLNLNYIQIGLALSVPGIIGNLIEPFLGVLGDIWKRRVLILGGGIFFGLACFLTAVSHNFVFLLISFILFNPASGAFVTLSQATLMDRDPTRHEQNMARLDLGGVGRRCSGPIAFERRGVHRFRLEGFILCPGRVGSRVSGRSLAPFTAPKCEASANS